MDTSYKKERLSKFVKDVPNKEQFLKSKALTKEIRLLDAVELILEYMIPKLWEGQSDMSNVRDSLIYKFPSVSVKDAVDEANNYLKATIYLLDYDFQVRILTIKGENTNVL